MNNKTENKKILLYILTPVIVLLLCVSITVVALIKPYNKISVYLNLIFMDEFKSNPGDGLDGLVIRDGEIDMNYTGKTSETGEAVMPKFGEQFAVIRCDALETSVPVYWGSSRELFQRGACQATFSKLPGVVGNTVISAHEDTFFADLSSMKVGDKVTINTNYGEFVYTVTETVTFKKTNKKYVNPKNDERLTLYTCKKDVLGSSDERVGVVCELTEKKFYVQAEEGTVN